MYTTNNTSSLTTGSLVGTPNLIDGMALNLSATSPTSSNNLTFTTNPVITPKIEGFTRGQDLDFTIPVSASITPINPSYLSNDDFNLEDQNIIPNTLLTSSFTPGENFVEFFVYDANSNLVDSYYDWENWTVIENSNRDQLSQSYVDNATGLTVVEKPSTTVATDQIELSPESDLYNSGYENGILYSTYNFINYELGSTVDNPFYLSEISSDRTEISIRSNTIPFQDIQKGYATLKNQIEDSRFFDEFYVSFFNNDYFIGVNCLITGSNQVQSTSLTADSTDANKNIAILIKLYEPLPTKYSVKDQLYVASKVGESQAYRVEFIEDLSGLINQANFIKGPNINIPLKDLVNNSTTLKSYEELTSTPSSESLNNLLNTLNKTGVTITPDYSYNTFNEFINFSSAKERINNFYEKVSQIQSYEADIEVITQTTGSNPTVNAISSSLASLQTNVSNLVKNFDGYETYLYNTSSSFAYPKTGSAYPYQLQSTGSTEVLEWLGSSDESSQYYGGYVLSASLYDENNQNWLYYTIPDFIKENSSNDEYLEFSNMVGQSFDEIWIYTKALSERYNTTNDPDSGLPLGLAADAIKGLGFETYGNNYNNQDNFIGLTGEDNGIYVPPTGSELITQYIAVNGGQIINYWSDGYAWANYVQSISEPGFPYAIDKVSKEIFKRLYHNMAYLTKKKGTISGLRQLINIWGIPNTILRINEYGGKNRDNSNDYDLWYNRFNYTYTPVANSYAASSSVRIPWMPLERNRIAENEYIVPDGLAFRFKTTGYPSSSFGGSYYSQSLAVKKSNGTKDNEFDFGIGLFYEDQPSGSYSGSSNSDYYEYGKMRFYISASSNQGGVMESEDIFLPFFNKGWWSVSFQRDAHVSASVNNASTMYTLQVANNQYNGVDGNIIGWTGSVSMSTSPQGASGYGAGLYGTILYGETGVSSSANKAWNDFGVTEVDGIYLGGFISGSNVVTEELNEAGKIFSGSLQEFRYYSNNISTEVFHDFTMNPESVEGNSITGSESSFDIVNFRAPLGNELEHLYTASQYGDYIEPISSSHPAVTGSAVMVITSSFVNPSNNEVTSSYDFIHYSSSAKRTYSKPNTEVYLVDQPSIGVRNRVSNKIQVEDGDAFGKVLSRDVSIDQNYLISKSYTEDVTNFEVAFSPQDEVNDDIIATFGYGVISDTLGDPRFAFDSKLNYYPRLRNIAIDYFKKYTEGNVYDYLRLIKYFDNSLFKAIKAYVPARTSVSTGVVIKQNLLERNRRPSVTITPNTTVSRTIETGSLNGVPTKETGLNSAIQFRDLELTGSVDVALLEGGAGGSPNPLNIINSQSGYFSFSTQNGPNQLESEYLNLLDSGLGLGSGNIVFPLDLPSNAANSKDLGFKRPINTRFGVKSQNSSGPGLLPGTEFSLAISSSVRGILGVETITSASLSPINTVVSTSFYFIDPEETISFWYKEETPSSGVLRFISINTLDLDQSTFTSSIHNQVSSQSYIQRNETISGSVFGVHKSQDEFYNGEYSGSSIEVTNGDLLENPYLGAPPRDIQYTILNYDGLVVDSSTPTFDRTQINTLLSTFDGIDNSFDIIVNVKGTDAEDDPYEEMGDYLEDYIQNGRNCISLWKKPNAVSGEDRYYIAGIFINRYASDGTDFANVVMPGFDLSAGYPGGEEAMYYGGVEGFPQQNLNDPIDSFYYQKYITGSLLNGNALATLDPYPTSPIFNFTISGSENGNTVDTNAFLNFQMGAGTNRSEIPSNRIQSVLFNNDSSNITTFPIANPQLPSNTPVGILLRNPNSYRFIGVQTDTNGEENSYLSIDVDKDSYPNFNIEQNYSVVAGVYSPIDALQQLNPTYLSNYHASYSLALDKVTGITPGYLLGVGSGSLLQYRQTFLGFEEPDTYAYTPMALAINKFSIDPITEVTYNNSANFLSTPTFNFEVSMSFLSNPSIVNGESGSEFYQGLTSNQGPFISQGTVAAINSQNLYWTYGTGSRVTSGISYAPPLGIYAGDIIQKRQSINLQPNVVGSPIIFSNSDYYPLNNNVSGSEKNTYVKEVEYGNGIGIPSNLQAIIDDTALPAPVNDSFYTTNANIIPRYLGSTLQSANYNTYTEPNTEITFLNTMSGSNSTQSVWDGDVSYANQSVIDKNPIYFAHFKTSHNNLNLKNTYTFEIDSLILSPTKNVNGEGAPITPVTIKVDGSGQNLTEVRSTFELGRTVGVAYDSSLFNKINYGNVKLGNKKIFQGSLEMITTAASTEGPQGTGEFNYPIYTPTMSFSTGSFINEYESPPGNVTTTPGEVYPIAAGSAPITQTSRNYIMTGENTFWLGGAAIGISNYLYTDEFQVFPNPAPFSYQAFLQGPGLAIMNSMNSAVSRSIKGQIITDPLGQVLAPGISTNQSASFVKYINDEGIGIVDEDRNYFIENFSGSQVPGFKENEGGVPFIIKAGDEIVVTYNDESNAEKGTGGITYTPENFVEQVFVVTGVTGSLRATAGGNNETNCPNVGDFKANWCTQYSCTAPGINYWSNSNDFLMNKITVYPNPSEFNFLQKAQTDGISYGGIDSFIIRRRVNADDRVIIYQSPPTNFGLSETTGSGGGYLIPGDFTPTQRRNALTLINQLKQKNAFRDDSQLPDFDGTSI